VTSASIARPRDIAAIDPAMNRVHSARPSRASPSRRGAARASRRSGIGGTLVGLFVGIALGLGLAAGAAFYLLRAGNPYQASVKANANAREPAKETARSGKPESPVAERPRFDFYKILPGIEEPKAPQKAAERSAGDKATAERALAPDKSPARAEERPAGATDKSAEPAPRAPKSGERFWLQAGSFASEGDAENLKAQLALSGWEASLQQATLPDRSVRYRVRLGPYDNTDELNRVRGELARRGFEATAIRN
jgi:cell division protein FtsN